MGLIFLTVLFTATTSFAGSINDIGADYLKAIRAKESTTSFKESFLKLHLKDLKNGLQKDEMKKAFWLNLYNGLVIESLRKNPKLYDDRSSFFSNKIISFSDFELSLDDIEHGILRGSRSKYGLGYLPQFFSSQAVKELKVNSLDFRIHFALNCGAESCPAVHFYDDKKIDAQLEKAMLGFLEQDVVYNAKEDELTISRIFLWFHGDFDGGTGIRNLIAKNLNLPITSRTDLSYKEYDWSLKVD